MNSSFYVEKRGIFDGQQGGGKAPDTIASPVYSSTYLAE